MHTPSRLIQKSNIVAGTNTMDPHCNGITGHKPVLCGTVVAVQLHPDWNYLTY